MAACTPDTEGRIFLLDASFWVRDAGKTQKKKKPHSESRKRGRRIPCRSSVLRLGDPSLRIMLRSFWDVGLRIRLVNCRPRIGAESPKCVGFEGSRTCSGKPGPSCAGLRASGEGAAKKSCRQRLLCK